MRTRECPDCGHVQCDEGCVCNCDAAHAEHEAAILRVMLTTRHAEPIRCDAADRLDLVCRLLQQNGCDCDCDHDVEGHSDDCDRCLACRIDTALSSTR